MAKKRLLITIPAILTILLVAACQKPQGKREGIYPLTPETFISDMITNTEDSYECSALPWMTPKEQAQEIMGEYDFVSEDDGGTITYQSMGKAQNGKELLTEICLGISIRDYEGMAKNTLGSIDLGFYMEDQETAEQLFRQQCEEARQLAAQKNESPFLESETVVLYQKESGSYIRVQYLGEMIPEEAEYKGCPWEPTYGVRIGLFMPANPLDLMLDGIDSIK